MALTKVEILVKGIERLDHLGAGQLYDIITIQPSGTTWGKGDLTGRFVFCTELDLPCGDKWKKTIRCSQCEHYGIEWETYPPTIGTKGASKTSCEMMKYEQPNMTYVYSIDNQGWPQTSGQLVHKNSGKLDFSKLETLSKESIDTVNAMSGSVLITNEYKDLQLEHARAASNIVSKTSLEVKAFG